MAAGVSGVRSGLRRPRGRPARAALLTLIGLGAYIVVAVTALGLTALAARSVANEALQVATAGIEAGRAGKATVAKERLDTAASMFGRTASRLDGWWLIPGDLVPGARQNRVALRDMAQAGARVSSEAARAAESAGPEQVGIRDGSVDLTALEALSDRSHAVATTAAEQREALRGSSSGLLIPPVSARLDAALRDLKRAEEEARAVSEAARLSGRLFGGDGPRRYFVILMSPAELRASGGVMGNFGILETDEGALRLQEFARTDELTETRGLPRPTISGPPDYLRRYARWLPATTWANVTMSPDFPTVGQVIAEVYPQSGGSPVDGVIGLDPAALAALLELVGPVTVPGWPEPITAENAETVLLYEQYLRFPTPERVEFLADTARATFDKLTSTAIPLAEASEVLRKSTASRNI